jgi:hypothetical protein
MARNEDHPDTRKRAASSREHAAKRANTWPKDMAGSEDELEAEALRQYAEEVRLHVPGFAVSAIPRRIVVPCRPSGTQTVSMYWKEPHRWKDARAELVDPFNYGGIMEPQVPKAWAYTKLVGDALPERFDLPNPKLYSLAGKLLPWTHPPGQVGRLLAGAFDALLVEVFQDAATNAKRAEVRAFLDHHRTNGGNPEALADHVHGLVSKWRQAPPVKWNIYKAGNEPIPRHDILTDTVAEWLKEAPMAATSAKAPSKEKDNAPTPKRPTLADKLGEVPEAAERFMELVMGLGLADASGKWIAGNDTKGKGKLIAAWGAVVKVLKVPSFDTDAALVKALKDHFDGLKGLNRLDKVRDRYVYTERLDEYIEDLRGN